MALNNETKLNQFENSTITSAIKQGLVVVQAVVYQT